MQTTVRVPTPSTFFAAVAVDGGAALEWERGGAAVVAADGGVCVFAAVGVGAWVATGGAVGVALAIADGVAPLPEAIGGAETAVLNADRAAVNGPAGTPAVVRGAPAPCCG